MACQRKKTQQSTKKQHKKIVAEPSHNASGDDHHHENEVVKEGILEGYIDLLSEKKSKKRSREENLKALLAALRSNVDFSDVDTEHLQTLLHLCTASCNSKKSSAEATFACQVIGVLAAVCTKSDIDIDAFSECSAHLTGAAKLQALDPEARIAALQALAMLAACSFDECEANICEVMAVLWHEIIFANSSSDEYDDDDKTRQNSDEAVRAAALLAWAFLVTILPEHSGRYNMDELYMQSLNMLSSLLDYENQEVDYKVRISAGEAIAVLFETMAVAEEEVDTKITEMEQHIVDQVRALATEAGGKGQRSYIKLQRSCFKEILTAMEQAHNCGLIELGFNSSSSESRSEMIKQKLVRCILGDGLEKHLHQNPLLQQILGDGFNAPECAGKHESKITRFRSKVEKRMYMSPNSLVNKARTQGLNHCRARAHIEKNLGFRF